MNSYESVYIIYNTSVSFGGDLATYDGNEIMESDDTDCLWGLDGVWVTYAGPVGEVCYSNIEIEVKKRYKEECDIFDKRIVDRTRITKDNYKKFL